MPHTSKSFPTIRTNSFILLATFIAPSRVRTLNVFSFPITLYMYQLYFLSVCQSRESLTVELGSIGRGCVVWSGIRESNSSLNLGKVSRYHFTNPACFYLSVCLTGSHFMCYHYTNTADQAVPRTRTWPVFFSES